MLYQLLFYCNTVRYAVWCDPFTLNALSPHKAACRQCRRRSLPSPPPSTSSTERTERMNANRTNETSTEVEHVEINVRQRETAKEWHSRMPALLCFPFTFSTFSDICSLCVCVCLCASAGSIPCRCQGYTNTFRAAHPQKTDATGYRINVRASASQPGVVYSTSLHNMCTHRHLVLLLYISYSTG